MKRFIEWLVKVIIEFFERRRKMDYFITLNEKSIDAIGEAVEKPITVIEGLKETLAETIQEKDEIIAQKDEIIADKDEEIEGLEEQIDNALLTAHTVSVSITEYSNIPSDSYLFVSGGSINRLNSMFAQMQGARTSDVIGPSIQIPVPAIDVNGEIILSVCAIGTPRTLSISRQGFANNTTFTKVCPSNGVGGIELGAIDPSVTNHYITIRITA